MPRTPYAASMRRLSSVDSAFWFAETPSWHMHIGALAICDPSAAPNFSFDAVRDIVGARLSEMPALRYRVVEELMGLDRPWLVEDPDIDLDFHMRRVAVAAPGRSTDLETLVGRLMSDKLDRSKPPWEMWFIEGLEHGRVALLTKIHHALVDGVSVAALSATILDITPEPRPQAAAVKACEPGGGVPWLLKRALGVGFNIGASTPYRIARFAQQALVQHSAVGEEANQPPGLFDAPRSRFNTPLTAQRRISIGRVPLDRVKAVKDAFGVTVNDVVLALVSGGLRRYLERRDELPVRSLVASIPVSTGGDAAEVGNNVSSMRVALATNVAQPADRMKTIHANSQVAKEISEARAAHHTVGLTDIAPPGVLGLAARVYSASHLGGRLPIANVIVSNVRGPDFPMYLAGAAVEKMLPFGPLVMDVGLNITCVSYRGFIDFGFLTTPQFAHDVEMLADTLEPALAELEKAVGIVRDSPSAPAGPPTRASKRRKRGMLRQRRSES